MRQRKKRTRWSDELVEKRLQPHIDRYGRMPSANELRHAGETALGSAIVTRGGFRAWALRLGLKQKNTETHRGQRWERHEALYLRSLGFDVVGQTTRAPFDLLVNGHRVDVKSAEYHAYLRGNNSVRGYVFAGLRRGDGCDFFDLVCVANIGVLYRYVVPAHAARIQTLTITPKTIAGRGKYSEYLDTTDLLRRDGD